MTTFTLGINTCFAVKRWPEPEAWARIVREDLGLDLVQHSLDLVDIDPSGPASVRQEQALAVRSACDRYSLELHSTFTGLAAYSSNLLLHPDAAFRDRALRWYRTVIDFTAEAGAVATGGHVGAFSVADARAPDRRSFLTKALARDLGTLAAHAEERGLHELLIENLAAGREPSTMSDIRALTRPGDSSHVPVVLCLDVGHQCVAGTTGSERDPYAWLAAFAPSLGMVQLQQSDAEADHHWPFTASRNASGRIDPDRVLTALAGSGARRIPLVLEVIPPFEQDDDAVVADLVESCRFWQDQLAKFNERVAARIGVR